MFVSGDGCCYCGDDYGIADMHQSDSDSFFKSVHSPLSSSDYGIVGLPALYLLLPPSTPVLFAKVSLVGHFCFSFPVILCHLLLRTCCFSCFADSTDLLAGSLLYPLSFENILISLLNFLVNNMFAPNSMVLDFILCSLSLCCLCELSVPVTHTHTQNKHLNTMLAPVVICVVILS